MRGGEKAFLATVALAVTGCTADDGKLNVRAIADPLAAASKRGSPMIVEARAALALGNVGTALEAFRKALREQPDSIEALVGIAACYERMGRYDLSRVNYEAALAIAPNNPVLLNSFAASLQMQGRLSEANALRAEAAQAEAAEVAAAVQMVQADITPVPIARSPKGVATAAPPAVVAKAAPPAPVVKAAPPAVVTKTARPAPVVKATPPAVVAKAAPPAPVSEVATPALAVQVALAARPQPTTSKPESTPQAKAPLVYTEVVGTTEWKIEAPKTKIASSVTVALPPPRPVEQAPAAPAPVARRVAAVELAPTVARPVAALEPATPEKPAAPPIRKEPAPVVAIAQPKPQGAQPRLQRLTMGEVALLTGDRPAWRAEVVAQTQRSVTARFVPLKDATATAQTARFVPLRTVMAASRPNIRLLNAARRQGLAARTRETLLDRGWRKIAIGDAAQVRARSIVLYPASRQVLGKRVAAQFGFASAINYRSDDVIVLLGRDAASLTFRRSRA